MDSHDQKNKSNEKFDSLIRSQRLVLNLLLVFGLLVMIPVVLPLFIGGENGFAKSFEMSNSFATFLVPLWAFAFLYSVGKLSYKLDGVMSSILHCLALFFPPLGIALLIFLNFRVSNALLKNRG